MFGKPSKRLQKHLEENGTRAKATIVEIAEKGMAVTRGAEGVIGNTELALKTHLRVQPEGEPEFEVKKRFSYPQLAVPSAGQTIPVIFDPEDHDKIIVDYSPEAQRNAALSAAGLDAEDASQLGALLQQFGGQGSTLQAGMPGMTPQAPATAQPEVDPVSQLERLAKLKDSGALTEAEFQAEKQKILGQ